MKLNVSDKIEESLDAWINKFLTERKTLGASKNTIKVYERALSDLREFAYLERINENENLKMEDIKRYFVIAFVNFLKERNLSDKTIKTYLDILYSFLLYVSFYNSDGIDLLYKNKKVTIKLKQKEIIVFSDNEYEKIKNELIKNLEKTNKYSKYKNYLAVYLLMQTGARFDEIANLKFDDIFDDDDFYKLKITGKGEKERYVYIEKRNFRKYLDKLITLHPQIEKKYLFIGKNKNLPYTTLHGFFQRFTKKLNIPEQKRHLHILRHTLATRLLKNGVDLKTVSEILGHHDLSVTARYYAKVDEEQKKKALKKVN
jgi:site-specific recombinase XerD